MKTMKSIFAGLLCSAFALFTFTASAQERLEDWEHNHPEASKALGEWVKAHKDGAHYIFEWDGNHPERSQALVTWAIDHPRENLRMFHVQHRDWPELDEIERTHLVAMKEFLIWCRNHGPAARALMVHPGALKWCGDHLWKTGASMEHPLAK